MNYKEYFDKIKEFHENYPLIEITNKKFSIDYFADQNDNFFFSN